MSGGFLTHGDINGSYNIQYEYNDCVETHNNCLIVNLIDLYIIIYKYGVLLSVLKFIKLLMSR